VVVLFPCFGCVEFFRVSIGYLFWWKITEWVLVFWWFCVVLVCSNQMGNEIVGCCWFWVWALILRWSFSCVGFWVLSFWCSLCVLVILGVLTQWKVFLRVVDLLWISWVDRELKEDDFGHSWVSFEGVFCHIREVCVHVTECVCVCFYE
jgi:hypothetical protein